MPQLFSNLNTIYLLYLFYGASFLFLGVSIAAKDMKGSDLRLSDSLWLLAAFGFLHGIREWLELGPLIEKTNLSPQQLFAEKLVAVILTTLSFFFLLRFGISLLKGLDDRGARWMKAIALPLALVWAWSLWQGVQQDGYRIGMLALAKADLGARLSFGWLAGVATSWGLITHAREIRLLSRSVARKLTWAGVVFLFYALCTLLGNSGLQASRVPVPIELLRGMAAFLITYFIVSALNIFDIETRKKIEQQTRRLDQAEKLTSLGQLAAGIAHEINNPLANASLGIEMLKSRMQRGGAGPDLLERLDAVERNIDRAAVIAQELLQFSRQRETEFVPLHIDDVIRAALTLVNYRLGAITVLDRLGRSTAPVMGDPGKLQQVFINILANAIEAMPDGGEITLSSRELAGQLEVEISDTGIGMEARHLSRSFDPFFTTKEIGRGTGLGLSICYGIIRQHDGSIEIASVPAKGTTVTIKLPTVEDHEKDTDSR